RSTQQRMVTQFLTVSRMLEQETKRFFAQFQLNHTEYRLLCSLEEKGDLSISALRKEASLASSSGTYTVERMIKKELVHRKRADHDRRFYSISLTEKGKQTVQEAKALYPDAISNFFSGISEEEKELLLC